MRTVRLAWPGVVTEGRAGVLEHAGRSRGRDAKLAAKNDVRLPRVSRRVIPSSLQHTLSAETCAGPTGGNRTTSKHDEPVADRVARSNVAQTYRDVMCSHATLSRRSVPARCAYGAAADLRTVSPDENALCLCRWCRKLMYRTDEIVTLEASSDVLGAHLVFVLEGVRAGSASWSTRPRPRYLPRRQKDKTGTRNGLARLTRWGC